MWLKNSPGRTLEAGDTPLPGSLRHTAQEVPDFRHTALTEQQKNVPVDLSVRIS